MTRIQIIQIEAAIRSITQNVRRWERQGFPSAAARGRVLIEDLKAKLKEL